MARPIVNQNNLAEARHAADADKLAHWREALTKQERGVTVEADAILALKVRCGLFARSDDATAPRTSLPALPARIGPVEFSNLGAMVSVRCPRDLDPLMRKAGGLWEPSSHRWLIERWRMGPLMRELRRATDPLFRRAGMDLDQPPSGGLEENR